ncbi:unnamed protein product [Musa hybrid cultivar]
MKRHIFVDDKSCSLCKEMLYQPAVLNRGHGYILCLANLSDLSGEPLQCQICESLDPGEFPNVFLDLDHFLEEEFLRVCSEKRTSPMSTGKFINKYFTTKETEGQSTL